MSVQELQEFFLNHWLNDNLGQISNAHVVHADREPPKARSAKCIELAKLFSTAVDFSKTGVPAIIPHYLRAKEYPDFMEKEDKPMYRSERVIGKLFRSVKEAATQKVPDLDLSKESMSKYYDQQLQVSPSKPQLLSFNASHVYNTRSSPHLWVLTKLCLEIEFRKGIVITQDLQTCPLATQSLLTSSSLQVSGFEDYVEEAITRKNEYDVKLIGLMNQYGIETEAELIGGNILRLSRHFRRRVEEVKKRVQIAVNLLKQEARAWFFGHQGEEEEEEECWEVDHLAKASAWYHVTYHPDYFHNNDQFAAATNVNLHLLSFPWVVSNILFEIKGNHNT
jgi:hypothetical protein